MNLNPQANCHDVLLWLILLKPAILADMVSDWGCLQDVFSLMCEYSDRLALSLKSND